MGTNYYAQIIPSVEQIKTLKDYIDENKVDDINNLVHVLYSEIDEYSDEPHNIIHLGKNSGGWVFLWNPNVVFGLQRVEATEFSTSKFEPSLKFNVYGGLDHKHIHDFIFRDDVILYDEYGEKVDKDEFWKLATEEKEKGKHPDLYDVKTYRAKNPKKNTVAFHRYEPTRYEEGLMKFFGKFDINNGEFYSDGMRFASTLEFS